MANRIRGTVIIIDSPGIVNFPGGGTQARVANISFWAPDTTGALQMSFQANSSDIVVNMASPVNVPNTTTLRLTENAYLQKLWVNTITAGTGYLYFT